MNRTQMRTFKVTAPNGQVNFIRARSKSDAMWETARIPNVTRFDLELAGWSAERVRVSDAALQQRKAAAASRWQGRGTSATVRVDIDAAEALKKIPLADRRKVASDAIRSGVKAYATLANIS